MLSSIGLPFSHRRTTVSLSRTHTADVAIHHQSLEVSGITGIGVRYFRNPLLGSIRELYRIEHKADKDKVDLAERLRIRQESSTPIVTALWTRMEAMQAEVLPSSAIGGALTYAINQKVALQRFLEDARFRLDNNWAENHMRPMAVGRKNFLTVGSKDGGDAAAIMYSFTESCRLAGINPLDYFRDVIPRLSYHPRDRLAELLPCNWSPIPPTGDRIIMPPMPRRQATTANA